MTSEATQILEHRSLYTGVYIMLFYRLQVEKNGLSDDEVRAVARGICDSLWDMAAKKSKEQSGDFSETEHIFHRLAASGLDF